jgi:hypothetical protein
VWVGLSGYLGPILVDSMLSMGLCAPKGGPFVVDMQWFWAGRAHVFWHLSPLGMTALLSLHLCFWVKLPLLARDRSDLSLWKLALSATRFDPLVTVRCARGARFIGCMRLRAKAGSPSKHVVQLARHAGSDPGSRLDPA